MSDGTYSVSLLALQSAVIHAGETSAAIAEQYNAAERAAIDTFFDSIH